MIPFDVFIDLTDTALAKAELHAYGDDLCCSLLHDSDPARRTIASAESTPPRTQDAERSQAAVLLERAANRAAASHRHLLILLGPLRPDDSMILELVDALERDPMFGTAQPRFQDAIGEQIWPLPGNGERVLAGSHTSRAALPRLAPCAITPELLAACMMVRWNLLAASPTVDHSYNRITGTLLHLLCQARRRGLRNVVANRAVLTSEMPYARLYPPLQDADQAQLQAAFPEHALALSELESSTQRRLEPLVSTATAPRESRRLLLDGRGMGPQHNGTSQAVLHMLDGFAAHACAGNTDILVGPEAAAFHHVPTRYSTFRLLTAHPAGNYFAAIRLTQPWDLNTVAELHRHALVIGFTMLDTIAWDVLHPTARGVELLWRFVARHSDVLVFTTHFSRDRFHMRFPPDQRVAELIAHHSLRADEYIEPAAHGEPILDRIVVFGNEYDHKDLRPCVQLLVDAFPFTQIIAFGTAEPLGTNVQAIPSGHLEDAALHRLIASARVIVFPSFYEGFGLPVVEGLAYGRPVVVRRSSLWKELASFSRLPGELIEFEDAPSLVESVGRVLAGQPTKTLASGHSLADGVEPAGWADGADHVLSLLNADLTNIDGGRWIERDEALRTAGY
jgi:glycosyltransferase involved in cell wall biosynthesis